MGVLDGRVACITGGRGNGSRHREGFLDEGAQVVVNGRDPDKARQTLDALGAGDRAHFIAGDVKQRASCEALVDGTVDHFGRIDILVANAGGGTGHAPIVDLTDEAMQGELVWNFWHTFWTMRRAFHYIYRSSSDV